MTVSAPLLALPESPTVPVVVAFVEIAKAPRLLASVGSKIPRDVVPMPVERLSGLCRRTRLGAVALSGVVVCVPEATLPLQERVILRELGRSIPVLRIFEDPREAGLTFFERCRESTPRIPRNLDRLSYRGPVVVGRVGKDDVQRLLLAENVSPGGVFLKDPALGWDPEELLSLRFPGLIDVPEMVGRVRWIREEAHRGQSRGYGCAFDSPVERAVRRLLAAVKSLEEERRFPALPPVRRLAGRARRR